MLNFFQNPHISYFTLILYALMTAVFITQPRNTKMKYKEDELESVMHQNCIFNR